MVGKLLDVLEADDAAARAVNGGETRRRLMDVEGADGLESDARPSGLESAGAHIVGAAHHRRGQEKRIFQRDAANLRLERRFLLRCGNIEAGTHIFRKKRKDAPDRHFARPEARRFAGSGAVSTGISVGQVSRRSALVLKPYAP